MPARTADEVLDFWFSAATQPSWFIRSEAFDARVRDAAARWGSLTPGVPLPIRRLVPQSAPAAPGELRYAAVRLLYELLRLPDRSQEHEEGDGDERPHRTMVTKPVYGGDRPSS